jgi:hypothetical protein
VDAAEAKSAKRMAAAGPNFVIVYGGLVVVVLLGEI